MSGGGCPGRCPDREFVMSGSYRYMPYLAPAPRHKRQQAKSPCPRHDRRKGRGDIDRCTALIERVDQGLRIRCAAQIICRGPHVDHSGKSHVTPTCNM